MASVQLIVSNGFRTPHITCEVLAAAFPKQ